jgi:hypothetical protein
MRVDLDDASPGADYGMPRESGQLFATIATYSTAAAVTILLL